MKPQLLKYSLQSLKKRKLRSSLTIISIMIGIMAIFAIVSFGQGLQKYTDEIFQKMGTDKIIVMPKGFGPPGTGSITFDDKDMEFIEKVQGVKEAAPLSMGITEIKFKKSKPKYAYALGQPTEGSKRKLIEEVYALKISSGRALKPGDKLKAALGHNYQLPNKIFPKAVKLGDMVEVNGKEVEAVGFFEEVGNPTDDSHIYLALEGFEEVLGKKGSYGYILVRTEKDKNPTEMAAKIKEKFRKHKNQNEGEEDFHVQTFEQLMETYGTVLLVLNGVLALIAFISLIVAGVNITNTMYTAVLERTKEVGVMKAIGAKNREITSVFLIESGILGALGGALGVILGAIIAEIGGSAAKYYGIGMLKPYFPLWLIAGCLLFAFAVGSIAGLLPAIQASRQKPVDALRYE